MNLLTAGAVGGVRRKKHPARRGGRKDTPLPHRLDLNES
jgi:hypothetical protein